MRRLWFAGHPRAAPYASHMSGGMSRVGRQLGGRDPANSVVQAAKEAAAGLGSCVCFRRQVVSIPIHFTRKGK